MAQFTNRMKTVCVGRFLIDLPAEAQLDIVGARFGGFDVAAFHETKEEFQKRLAERQNQIATASDRFGTNRNLESASVVTGINGLVGKMFVHSRTVTEGTATNGLELEHYRYEGVAVEALVHGDGVSIDLVASNYDPKKIKNLSKLVAQLVPNPGNEKPSEPGYCVDLAYFRDPLSAELREQITMFAKLPSHPDVGFTLSLLAGLKADGQGLLT